MVIYTYIYVYIYRVYVDHAGLKITNEPCIAWPFSRQIAIGNGSKTNFSLPFVKYCSNVQTVSERKFCLGPHSSDRANIFG